MAPNKNCYSSYLITRFHSNDAYFCSPIRLGLYFQVIAKYPAGMDAVKS